MSASTRVLLILALYASSAAVAASGPREATRYNEAGMVVLTAEGHRVNYSQAELLAQAPLVRPTLAEPKPSPGDVHHRPTSAAVLPGWSFAAFGEAIGGSNIVIRPVGLATEIIVGSSLYSSLGASHYWYSLRYDALSSDYRQVYVSSRYEEQIRRIVADGTNIAVALYDGTVYLHDLMSKRLVREITTAAFELTGLQLVDVDQDGEREIVVCTRYDLFVYAANGTLEWTLPVGGDDLVVGQLDTDPALEIAVTDGSVVDADTQSVQWTWAAGFGAMLEVADIDDDAIEELIAGEQWYFVWSFDVDRQLPKWSIPMGDIGAIYVTDIDGDSVQELLVGEGQWGEVIAFDTVTQQQEWSIANPEHGVSDVAVGDVDGDGDDELLWGAGATSSGSDRLYVSDWQTQTIEWQNIQLDGPFLGPEIGDLDGDGIPEIVLASWESEAGYGSGRIVVFDAQLGLRAISDEIVNGSAWEGTHDLRLIDVDADGRLEIAVAADRVRDGVVEIYDFYPDDSFSLNWTNTIQPDRTPFYSVEAADVDNDGELEIVAGAGRGEVYVYVYDYATSVEEWHSLQMGPYGGSISGLELGDLDSDGALEIVGMIDGGDAYIFDGPTKILEGIAFGEFTTMERLEIDSIPHLLLGDTSGDLAAVAFQGDTYAEVYRDNWVSGAVDGMTPGECRWSVWIGSEGTLRLVSSTRTFWESEDYGPLFGERVLADPRLPLFLSAGSYAAFGFRILRLPLGAAGRGFMNSRQSSSPRVNSPGPQRQGPCRRW